MTDQPEPSTSSTSEGDETAPEPGAVTAEDAERLAGALSGEAERAFRLMRDDLTRLEICRARLIHEGEGNLYASLSLIGEIQGLRLAMCHLLGIPAEEADHEAAVDTYMRGVWEDSGWEGWPG